MANEIIAGQSLVLTLDTNNTLNAIEISTAKIKYKRLLDDYQGEWTATINDGQTTLYKSISAGVLQPSTYIFWHHITRTDGSIDIGKTVKKRVNAEGKFPCK